MVYYGYVFTMVFLFMVTVHGHLILIFFYVFPSNKIKKIEWPTAFIFVFPSTHERRPKDDVKHCSVNILRQKRYFSINTYRTTLL